MRNRLPPLLVLTPNQPVGRHRRGELPVVIGTANGGASGTVPTIATVSQTAGKAAGGSVLSIAGTGFTGAMTSTLGVLSAITSTSCTLTTFAHAAGAVSWTLTTAGGSAPNQTFTYLAAPTFASATPNHGPQTLPTTGVTMTGAAFPPAGSGCPVTCTVDGHACSAIVLLGTTTFSCTVPTDTTSGLKTIAVTVDGVAATGGAGAWTYDPPPMDISATNVGPSGGSGTVTGTNFVATPTASVNIAGTPTALTVIFVSSTQLTFELPAGTYATGTWPITVTNPDGQSDTQTIFVISASAAPDVVFGAALKGWWRSDTGVTGGGVTPGNGGAVDSWLDKSGNGFTLTAAGTARPTYNTIATFVPPGDVYPSVTFNGTTNLLKNVLVNIDGSTDLTIFIVFKELTNTNNKMWCMWGSNSGLGPNRWALGNATGFAAFYGSAGASAMFGTAMSGAYQVYGGLHGASTAYAANVSASNAPAATGSSAQAWAVPTSGTFAIGGSTDGSTFSNIEVVEVVLVCGHNPTPTEYGQIAAYFNLRYLNTSPTFTESTVMLTTGTGFRISGTGFISGATVTFGGGLGVPTQTAAWVSSTLLEVPMPGSALTPGQYPVTITNPDGGSVTEGTGLTISSTASDTPLTATGDLSCIGWYDGSRWTLNGTGVSSLFDQSLRGNAMVQGTAANQPARVLADPDFAGANSVQFDGVQTYLQTTGNIDLTAGATAFDAETVARFDPANTNNGDVVTAGAGYGQANSTGSPRTFYGGNVATWGSHTGGQTKSIFTEIPFGASQTLQVNVNNGTAVTAASSPTNTAHAGAIGAYSAATFYKGKLAAVALFNRKLTAGEQTNLRNWAVAHYGA